MLKYCNMGVILSTTKLCARCTLIYTLPLNYTHTGKSQKKTEIKSNFSINKTVYCSFLMSHLNYVGMPAVYKKIYYSFRLIIFLIYKIIIEIFSLQNIWYRK